MMTVRTLIAMLQKVEAKDATVYLGNSSDMDRECYIAIEERDLTDDEICIVLKCESDK